MTAKSKEFDGKIKTNVLGNNVPKENMHYTCIACITIDSVMKERKKEREKKRKKERKKESNQGRKEGRKQASK